MEDRCVMCGEIIPEGRMVCPVCEERVLTRKGEQTMKARTNGCNHSRGQSTAEGVGSGDTDEGGRSSLQKWMGNSPRSRCRDCG